LLKVFDKSFRGRFSIASLANPGDAGKYAGMPDIPGIHVCVNIKGRTIKAVDPLGFPEHKSTLDAANRIKANVQGVTERPCDTSIINRATPTELKSALWEMRSYVDERQAVIIEGTLPSGEEILKMEGQLKIRQHTDALRVTHFEEGRPVKESLYASEEELDRLSRPIEDRVTTVPANSQ